MRRHLICLSLAVLAVILASVRLRPTPSALELPEATKKAAFAKVAKAWSADPAPLEAGWGRVDLPLAKLGQEGSTSTVRTGRAGLPPRLSVLILGQRGQPEAVLVTAELLSTPRRTGALIRAYAGEALAIPPERILIVATHTHAGPRPPFGPALRIAFGEPELEDQKLAAAVAYAADQAKQNYTKVRMGSSDSQLSTYIANRSPGASSPVDDRLRAITLNASGRRLLLWSYAAHPTLVSRRAQHADGDYPARVASILEEQAGYHQVIFLPGRTAHATVATQRHPDRLAEMLAHALGGLATIAENQSTALTGLAFEQIELPALEPRLPVVAGLVVAPWLHQWLGRNEVQTHLLRLGRVGLTFVSGEVSNGLVPSTSGDQWVVSMSGSGLGYLVDPRDRFVEPERPLVLLSEAELSQMGELLRIVAGSLSKDR